MSLVRVAGVRGERGQPPTLAKCTREPQKMLKTHNTFKLLWSVADRCHKAATQLPAADWEAPPCLARAAHAKCNPPLRTSADVEALRAALCDGTIDAVATDHAPHSAVEKEVEFEQAAFGIIGLETAVPLVLDLVRAGTLTPSGFVERLSAGPAALFGLPGGTLAPGAPGDVTVIDPEAAWTCEPATLRSRSRNTPFAGRALRGRAVLTVVGGAIVYAGETTS